MNDVFDYLDGEESARPLYEKALQLPSIPTAEHKESPDWYEKHTALAATNQAVFFNAYSAKSIGATIDADYCIAVILHDPVSTNTAFIHFAAPADLIALKQAVNMIRGQHPTRILKAYLIGGNPPVKEHTSEANAEIILRQLEELGGIAIKGADLIHKKRGRSFCFDARDRSFFYSGDVLEKKLYALERENKRIGFIGNYIKVMYRDLKDFKRMTPHSSIEASNQEGTFSTQTGKSK